MKILLVLITIANIMSCKMREKTALNIDEIPRLSQNQDILKISHNSLDYDITIIEPGFGSWLERMAKPTGYYSLEFLKSKNRIFVSEWNRRVLQTSQQYMNLYEMQINYNFNTNYGYEVNYKLYNYFIYFQIRYKQQLSGILPKI